MTPLPYAEKIPLRTGSAAGFLTLLQKIEACPSCSLLPEKAKAFSGYSGMPKKRQPFSQVRRAHSSGEMPRISASFSQT